MPRSEPRRQLESWVAGLEIKAERIIDIGGSQLPVRDRVKSWDVKDYKIFDLATPHENKQAPDISGDINRLWQWDAWRGVFDVAFALELSEYLWDPVQAFTNMNRFLKHYGVLYFSSHFNYPVHNLVEFDFLRYTREGIIKILTETGFKVNEVLPRTCQMNTGYPELMGFYSKQGMKWAKGSNEHTSTGHLWKAVKIIKV